MESKEEHEDKLKQLEYAGLRAEMSAMTGELIATDRWIIVAAGATWAWIGTHPQPGPVIRLAWFLPPALMLVASIRSLLVWKAITDLSGYLGRTFGGWEADRELKNRQHTGRVAVLYAWIFAVLTALAWAGYYATRTPG